MRDVGYLLASPEQGYRGTKASVWFLIAMLVLTTVRSLVHILAPDGGAETIAGIPVDGPSGDNIVAIFSVWGLAQLIIAIIGWVVVARYRHLVPLILALQFTDWFGRLVIVQSKPLLTAAGEPAPGEIGNYLFAPLCLIFLWYALPKRT